MDFQVGFQRSGVFKQCERSTTLRRTAITHGQNMSGNAVAIEFNGAPGSAEGSNQVVITVLSNIGKKGQPRVNISDGPRGALSVGKYCILTSVFNLLACHAIKTRKWRARRNRAQAELCGALNQRPMLGRTLIDCQTVDYADRRKHANDKHAEWKKEPKSATARRATAQP